MTYYAVEMSRYLRQETMYLLRFVWKFVRLSVVPMAFILGGPVHPIPQGDIKNSSQCSWEWVEFGVLHPHFCCIYGLWLWSRHALFKRMMTKNGHQILEQESSAPPQRKSYAYAYMHMQIR